MSDSVTKSSQAGREQQEKQRRRAFLDKVPKKTRRDDYVARFIDVGSLSLLAVPAGPNTEAPAAPAATVVQAAAAATGPLQPQWSGGVTIKKAFKGGANKKTCLIEVAGQSYVLKGAPRKNGAVDGRASRSTAEDNAAAASFIRSLNLKGVRAPAIRMMDDAEKAEVVAALQAIVGGGGSEARDASELISSLQNGEAQLSEPDAGGLDPDKIFGREDIAKARETALGIRRQHQADPDAAWTAAIAEVAKVATYKGKMPAYAAADDSEKREQALAALREDEVSPVILEYVRVLEEVARNDQPAGLERAKAEALDTATKQGQLRTFAKSPEGMAAYAGVAAADLLTGMEDRILGTWNGGNFLFDGDARELACVDNNKDPSKGLTETDPAGWNSFFVDVATSNSASIVDAVFDKIYTPVGNPNSDAADRPAAMPGFSLSDEEAKSAKEAIRGMLSKVIRKVESDPSSGPAARQRATFLKELMLLQDTLSVPPELVCKGEVEEPSTADKVLRGIKGIGRSWFADADKIKTSLRKDPLLAGKARVDLEALIKKHPKDSKGGNDRLAGHIRFLATACDFGELLAKKAATLRGLGGEPKFPTDAKAKQLLASVWQSFTAQADSWQGSLKSSDGAITARIATGVDDLRTVFTAREARHSAV